MRKKMWMHTHYSPIEVMWQEYVRTLPSRDLRGIQVMEIAPSRGEMAYNRAKSVVNDLTEQERVDTLEHLAVTRSSIDVAVANKAASYGLQRGLRREVAKLKRHSMMESLMNAYARAVEMAKREPHLLIEKAAVAGVFFGPLVGERAPEMQELNNFVRVAKTENGLRSLLVGSSEDGTPAEALWSRSYALSMNAASPYVN